jgi:hypothetical protein
MKEECQSLHCDPGAVRRRDVSIRLPVLAVMTVCSSDDASVKTDYFMEWNALSVQWLRHYSTNRQIAGSISGGVIGIFQ